MNVEKLLAALKLRQANLCDAGREIAEIQAIIDNIENNRPFQLPSDVNDWFELTTSTHYLTIPRSALEAMPLEWQWRFVECLNELDQVLIYA